MKPKYEPMLAEAADSPFSSSDWIFEVKWDGIRAISYVDNNGVSVLSRNGNELIQNFPELRELKELTRNVVLDGEIVLISEGKVDFQALIERSRATSPRYVDNMSKKYPATYVVFDMLEKDGVPLVGLPLAERKKMLGESVKEGKNVVLSLFIEGRGEEYYEGAIKLGMEGIMAKRKDSPYEAGRRSDSWLKIKRLLTCDCAIFGYTEGEGARSSTFGALILGLYRDSKAVFVGKVGTGFTEDNSKSLMEVFEPLKTDGRTLEGADAAETIIWLRPELVCEVVYQTVTREGRLRMPRFKGLRPDKRANECTFDQLQSRLKEYHKKRDFTTTSEPSGIGDAKNKENAETDDGLVYVVQEHHARRLHYDLRLERAGVLKSWAVPKGLPEKQGEKRLAVQTEDHPLDYGGFEGEIPKGEYGAGTVTIWDRGSYKPIFWGDDMIEFLINGEKIHGRYILTRFKKAGEKQWLLLRGKEKVG
jgi:DNA ligase D-like protein (predicted ligase)/DNA ligase D-like protein (predicted 3'-phosphoesterase)